MTHHHEILEWKTEFSISDIKWGALLFGMKCYSIMTQPKTILQPQKSLPHDVTFKTANWSPFLFWSSNETWLSFRSGHKPQFFVHVSWILEQWGLFFKGLSVTNNLQSFLNSHFAIIYRWQKIEISFYFFKNRFKIWHFSENNGNKDA